MTDGDWSGATEEKKFRLQGDTFIKSTLHEEEWQCHPETRRKYEPKIAIERAKNEAANMRYIRKHTNIPVPEVLDEHESDGVYTIVMTRAEGVTIASLTLADREIAIANMEHYFESFHKLKSSRLGGVSGLVCPPHPVLNKVAPEDCHWTQQPAQSDSYVFCHMDAHQENILVDPKTLEISCILDFEFAGFYPQRFDLPLYRYDLSEIPNRDVFADDFLSFLHTKW
jgi:aminoglycoside phosphotransferase